MAEKDHWRYSLKQKITLLTLAIFVVGICGLSYYVTRMLRHDMENLLADQQVSTVSFVAAEINAELEKRIDALEKVARSIDPPLLGNPAALQQMLEQRTIFQGLFNAGILTLSLEGTAVADIPLSAGRRGTNYFDNEANHTALTEGKSAISGPMMGRKLHQPVFNIAVPIRDAGGKIIGALVGTINLAQPNFLDIIGEHQYGKRGGYLVVDPKHNLFVTATDKSRVLQPIPAPGINGLLDRRLQGFDGPEVSVNSLGVENLSSVKRIPAAGWFVIAVLPTEEAFAPIRDMQKRIAFATILLTLVMGIVSWWLLRRQFSPLVAAVETLAGMSDAIKPLQPLPIVHQDEIGQLVGGFNRLLGTLRRHESQLETERDFFSALLRQSSDGVFLFSPDDLSIHEANPSLCRMLGYERDELLALKLSDLVDAPLESLRENVRQTMQGKLHLVGERNYRRKDGGRIAVEVNASIVETLGRQLIMANLRDITERRGAEAARAKLESQLRESQKMEALGTLAGGVAHDFNNVLAVIMGNVELVRQDLGPAHTSQEKLEEIRKASQRAKNLVQQILAFSRRQVLERKVIWLAPVVEESVRMLRATLPAGVSVHMECAADAPAVLADATQIQQVLLNLCSNAWQAMQGQTRPGKIEIRLETHDQAAGDARDAHLTFVRGNLPPGRYTCLSVRDNGSGMDRATVARIFEPFFTTKPVGKGTGLGLAVVHGIVQEHEASVEVHSEPGEGTTFRIYFPAVDAQVAVAPKQIPTVVRKDSSDAPVLMKKGKHILYVDDDEAIVLLMTHLLERKGYRVSGYTDAREALAAVRAEPGRFDLAVTDHNMPGMSGLEVASALREIRADLPVALASGYITDELREKAPATGVRELIYKPNTVDELCETIARLANYGEEI